LFLSRFGLSQIRIDVRSSHHCTQVANAVSYIINCLCHVDQKCIIMSHAMENMIVVFTSVLRSSAFVVVMW